MLKKTTKKDEKANNSIKNQKRFPENQIYLRVLYRFLGNMIKLTDKLMFYSTVLIPLLKYSTMLRLTLNLIFFSKQLGLTIMFKTLW